MGTEKKWSVICIVISFLIVVSHQTHLMASPISEVIKSVANKLKAKQIKYGASQGTWPEECDFTGSIAIGMVDAYDKTGESSYWACAELAGHYILWASEGNFRNDGAPA